MRRLNGAFQELAASGSRLRTADILPPPSVSPARRRAPLLAAAAAAAGLLLAGGYGVARLSSAEPPAAETAGAPRSTSDQGLVPQSADVQAIASGTNYSREDLAAQVDRTLAGRRPDGLKAASGRLSDPASLRECLDGLGVPGAQLVLADIALFEDQPAAVLVLATQDGTRQAWVVSTTCRSGQDGTKYFQRLR